MCAPGEVAPSYVPARNSVFLALAAGRADAWGAQYIAYAAHWEDAPGYPDCRPEYYVAMRQALELGTKNGVRLLAPFIDWGKTAIIRMGALIGVPYELTHSCYKGTKPACGVCDTCILRIESFRKAGIIDPIDYAIDIEWFGGEVKQGVR
jgi:7-cyano-7-deazaguanine synthase